MKGVPYAPLDGNNIARLAGMCDPIQLDGQVAE